MELGSPAGDAVLGSDSGRRQSPREATDGDVVCSPGQSPDRVGDDEEILNSPCGLTVSPTRSGERTRRTEKTLLEGDRTPTRHRTPSPDGKTPAGAVDATDATPSTPRRGQKRPGVTPRRPGSSEDICEVFSSLSKRRRTAPPASLARRREEQPASPASEEVRSASTVTRQSQGASPAPGLQEPRPVSTDSDIQILDEAPVVFTQRVKSPRGSSGRGETSPRRSVGRVEDAKSPVAASKKTRCSDSDTGSVASPARTPSKTAVSREQSPVGDASLLCSPPLLQAQSLRQSERGNDSDVSSPLISRRQEQSSGSQALSPMLASRHRKSRTNEADSPAQSHQLASEPSHPVTEGNDPPAFPPPYSPELPVVTTPHSVEPSSPIPPRSPRAPASPLRSSRSRPRSVSPSPSPGKRFDSPAGSPPRDVSPGPDAGSPPPSDVWDGFEDGGYIELMEPLSSLGTPLRPAAGSTPTTTAVGPVGQRSSLDSSELWQDSSLLAGYTTPKAAEKTTDLRQMDAGVSKARHSDAGTPDAVPEDSRTAGSTAGDAGTPGPVAGDAETRGPVAGDAETPDTGMPPPQRTPVNPYRVVLRDSNTPMPNYVLMLTPELKVGAASWRR